MPGGPVEPLRRQDMVVDLDMLMLALGGVVLESIPDAVMAYDGLFTRDGLKSARQRGGGVFPLENPFKGKHPHVVVRYQRKGRGRKMARAVFLPGIDPKIWLEQRLGGIAFVEEE
jgi:hypothetical protein